MAAQRRGSVKVLVQPSEALVGRDGHARLLLPFRQNLEQQLGAAPVELHVSQLTGAEQADAAVAGDGLGQLPVVGGQLVDELGGQGVADAVAGYGGLGAQRDEQVGLLVPLSPIRYSGRPFLTQSQVAWVWMTTGSTLGLGD